MMESLESVNKKTPNELKENGNRLFALGRFKEAIQCYSLAIDKTPHVSKFYSNRALCYIKLKEWDKSIDDSRKAIDRDQQSVKGHFFLGMAYIELQRFDEAVHSLMLAYENAKDQSLNFGDDIAAEIRRAKRLKYEFIDRKRLCEEVELQSYLVKLILEDRDRRIKSVIDNQTSQTPEDIEQETDKYISQVNNMVHELDDRRKKREIPEYLCGKISFELIREPVISPSGITYDRKDIEDHLHKVGHFDPITRKPLTSEQLIPNLAMKDVIDTFLEGNPWADGW